MALISDTLESDGFLFRHCRNRYSQTLQTESTNPKSAQGCVGKIASLVCSTRKIASHLSHSAADAVYSSLQDLFSKSHIPLPVPISSLSFSHAVLMYTEIIAQVCVAWYIFIACVCTIGYVYL